MSPVSPTRVAYRYLLAASEDPGTPKVEPVTESAERFFFNNPEQREVREFAQTKAVTNIPEVAAEAAQEDHLDMPEAEAVQDAKKGPPTPDEIDEEPGGKEFSTLNRFLVQTEDPNVKGVPESHAELPKHPKVLPEVQERLARWFG